MPRSHRWTTLAVVMTSVFMATLDSSAVNITLPTLAVELDATFDALQWVVLAYLLVITGLLLPFGRAADVLGRRRFFVAGLAIFVAGSLLSGMAVNVWMLVACRVLQGLGSAATQAIGAALVIDAFPENERGRAMGWVLSAVSAGLITGPLAGGVLVGTIGWRWIFYLNVPVGLISLALGLRSLPYSAPVGPRRFDFPGAASLVAGVMLVLFGLNRVQVAGIAAPLVLAPLLTGIVLLGGFLAWQRRSPAPTVDLGMFRVRELSAATLAAFLAFAGLSSLVLLLPFYLQRGLGLDPVQVGLVLATIPALMGLLGPPSGALADRLGPRPVASVGVALTAVGLVLMATLGDMAGPGDVVARTLVTGVGLALFNSANASSLMGAAAPRHRGQASATMSLARNTGQSVGQALWGTLWGVLAAGILGVAVVGDQPLDTAFDAFRVTWAAAAAVTLLALVASLARGPGRADAGLSAAASTPGAGGR